jgi:hypothetical protein
MGLLDATSSSGDATPNAGVSTEKAMAPGGSGHAEGRSNKPCFCVPVKEREEPFSAIESGWLLVKTEIGCRIYSTPIGERR